MRYSDSAVVSAAVRGRVLILEGIEKAERNVLPVRCFFFECCAVQSRTQPCWLCQ